MSGRAVQSSPAQRPPSPGTPSGSDRSSAGAQPKPAGLTNLWQRRDLRAVTTPELVGATALTYVQRGHRLYLYALDARSGKTRWRRPASTSATVPGVTLAVGTVGDAVAMYGPMVSGSDAARLMVLDVMTGRLLVETGRIRWTGLPGECDDNVAVVCASGLRRGQVREYRIRPRTGEVSTRPGGSNPVGDGLDEFGWGTEEYLTLDDSAKYNWAKPIAEAFEPGYSIDNGWDFELYADADTYAGTLAAPGTFRGHGRTVDVDTHGLLTAGIDTLDGTTWWRRRATSVDCNGALYQGVDDPAPVRCRYTGSVSFHYPEGGGPPEVRRHGYAVTIEGFDPQTGRTTWRRPMHADTKLIFNGNVARPTVDDELLVPGGHGLILNVRTGATRRPRSGEGFWCEQSRSLVESGGSAGRLAHTGSVEFACDRSGSPTTALPGAVPAPVGAHGRNGLVVISAPTGVFAYRG